jgi:hypothetical protein
MITNTVTPVERSGTGIALELYVRSLAPGGAIDYQEEVLRRADHLEAEGTVDEVAVTVWGSRVCPDSRAARTATGRFVFDRLAAFGRWADRNGVDLDLDREPVRSSVTGETRETVVLPVVALAEFRPGGLTFVAPCVDDGVPYAVVDHMDGLEEGRPPRWEAVPPDAPGEPGSPEAPADGEAGPPPEPASPGSGTQGDLG